MKINRERRSALSTIIPLCAFLGQLLGCRPDAMPAPHPAPFSCSTRWVGLNEFIGEDRSFLLGEHHGTNESTPLVLQLACLAGISGLPVRIGLELPAAGDGAVAKFLRSAGAASDAAEFLNSSIWHPELQDGRMSVAMFELFEGLRALRSAGRDVDAYLMITEGSSDRDERMAARVKLSLAETPRGFQIVLAGSNHIRIDRADTIGGALRADGHDVASIAIVGIGPSESWTCWGSQCGKKTVSIDPSNKLSGARDWVVERRKGFSTPGATGDIFDGVAYLPIMTASPPAIEVLLNAPDGGPQELAQ